MPSASFVRELHDESAAWVADGLVTTEQAAALRARYGAPREAGDSWTSILLYATAGVLLGAAAIALIMVGLEPQRPAIPLALAGVVLLAAGVALRAAVAARGLLADALLIAGLVPLTAAALPSESPLLLRVAALVAPAAVVAWRREASVLTPIATVAFAFAAAGFSSHVDDFGSPWWPLLMLVWLVGVVALDRLVRRDDHVPGAAVAAVAFAVSLVPWLGDAFPAWDSERVELALGAAMLVVMGAGIALRHRGLVLGAATALSVDAIVFAFDLGGPLLGTAVLVGLAILLIVQAEALKRLLHRRTRDTP